MCDTCGCKSAEDFEAEWRGRWDVGNERYDGQYEEFRYYIRKMGNNPQRFEVYIRGNNPEGRELIRQASKNPIFRNLRHPHGIKIGFFIQHEVMWEGQIIKGLYQVSLPKLVEEKRRKLLGNQVFRMTAGNMIMNNYGEPVIEGLYRTKQEAVDAIYYYFEEMEYPFHISNWPLDMESWSAKYGAEEFGASSNYDFSQIDKILQDMDEDGSIQLKNTDGSQVRRKALRIYENIRTVQEGIKQLREENAETFRIDALENYLLRLKYDLDNELNNWAMVNMNAEAEVWTEKIGAGRRAYCKTCERSIQQSTRIYVNNSNDDIECADCYEYQQEAESFEASDSGHLEVEYWDDIGDGEFQVVVYDDNTSKSYEGFLNEKYRAESFEATKGMDTYAQPLEELKIKPTKTKVGILLASIVAGGLWYSNKMKE